MDNVSPLQGATYVMVDYENINPSLNMLIQRHDTHFIVFEGKKLLSSCCDPTPELEQLGNRVEYVKICDGGINAVDFHIILFVGKITQIDPTAKFIIVSNNNACDPIIKYLNDNATKVEKINSIHRPNKAKAPRIKISRREKEEEHFRRIIIGLNAADNDRPSNIKSLIRLINSTNGVNGNSKHYEIEQIIYRLQLFKLIEVTGESISYIRNEPNK